MTQQRSFIGLQVRFNQLKWAFTPHIARFWHICPRNIKKSDGWIGMRIFIVRQMFNFGHFISTPPVWPSSQKDITNWPDDICHKISYFLIFERNSKNTKLLALFKWHTHKISRLESTELTCTIFVFPYYTRACCELVLYMFKLHVVFILASSLFLFNGHTQPYWHQRKYHLASWIQPWYASAPTSPHASSMDSWELHSYIFQQQPVKKKKTDMERPPLALYSWSLDC